jgi:5,10-methylene-tetrahydrofolate dehydrogenase/methenyl tetrahydrofolate cyclohydrolase
MMASPSSTSDDAILMDGKATAATIQEELTEQVQQLQRDHGILPGLAVVLVGNRPDSASYVRGKKKVATAIGIHSLDIHLPDTVTQDEVLNQIQQLNSNPDVHGILVQLPLPSHMNESIVLKAIAVDKDADGFSAWNIGNLCLKGGEPPLAVPCTPAGCIELLQRYNIPIRGKECVVLGRSNIVGMPVAALLQSCHGTVTVCHSQTQNIADHVQRADIIIAALGQAEFVRGDWIKPSGSVVIVDVGINSVPDTTRKSGYRLVGDVNFEECRRVASYITPVPGGVGPMTIIMLMKNTINLARQAHGLPRVPLRNASHRE